MSWDPPSAPPRFPPPTVPEPQPGVLRRISPVGWISLLGAGLLVLSGAVVLSSQWSRMGAGIRFGVFLLIVTSLLIGAERLRRAAPVSASVIAHLGTLGTGGVVVAGLAAVGATWPTCLAAGGLMAAGAAELQAPRWRRVTMYAVQVCSVAVGATGAAAIIHVPAGLLVVATAGLATALGRHRRSTALALAALFSPAIMVLAASGIGEGTFARAGLAGTAMGWAGPLIGVAVAGILAWVIRSDHSVSEGHRGTLLMAATCAPWIGLVAALSSGIPTPGAMWWALPGLLLIAIELGQSLTEPAIGRGVRRFVDAVALVNLAGAVISPMVIDIADSEDADLTLAAVTTSLGLALVAVRWHRGGRPLVDWSVGALAFSTTAVMMGLQASALLIWAAMSLSVFVAAFGSRAGGGVAVYPPAVIACSAATAWSDAPAETWTSVLFAALVAVPMSAVIAMRPPLHGKRSLLGLVELNGVVVLASLFAVVVSAATPVAVAVAVVTTGAVAIGLPGRAVLDVLPGFGIGFVLVALIDPGADANTTSGWAMLLVALVTLGFAIVGRCRVSRLVGILMVLLAGLRLSIDVNPLDWLAARMAPIGVTSGDLVVAVLVAVLLVVGGWTRRRFDVVSLLSVGPGLLVAILWLLDAELDRRAAFALPLALLLGVPMVVLGAPRRLAGPVAGGALLSVAVSLAALGNRLDTVPVWVWLAIAGSALIVAAIVVERADSTSDVLSNWR